MIASTSARVIGTTVPAQRATRFAAAGPRIGWPSSPRKKTTACAPPRERGQFLSVSSSVQQMASGLAAALAGAIVAEGADHSLRGYETVGFIAAASTLLSVWLAGRLRLVDVAHVHASGLAGAEEAATVSPVPAEAFEEEPGPS